MKLTRVEASAVMTKANEDYLEHRLEGYRYGQALWNMLPVDVCEDKRGVQGVDFFYEEDHNKVLDMFSKYYVEEG